MKHILFVILLASFTLAACSPTEESASVPATEPLSAETDIPEATPAPTLTPTASPTPENPIGVLSLEENEVRHGPDENALLPLLESASFFENDLIQVTDGGEAVLDFGDQMQLRLFNDTELHIVSAEIGEDVPLGVQIFLFVGGFTGQLTEEGGRADFRTPGEVEITVLGTEYFVVYNPETEETTAGNFSGTVEVTSAGVSLSLEDGSFVVVSAGSPPGPALPLPLSMEEFEIQAREAGSPVEAASQAKVWTLEIRHEFSFTNNLGSTTNHLRLWSGQFSLEGDTLTGSGTGVIDEVNVPCANPEKTTFDLQGSYVFDISGMLITGEDGLPAFSLEITTSDLEMTESQALASCSGLITVIQDLNRDIVTDMPLLNADSIVVEAAAGAEVIVELDGAPYNNENSIFFTSPMVVSVNAGQ